jgi:S1-C subfamily serine protease
MTGDQDQTLTRLSAAVAAGAVAVQRLVVAIRAPRAGPRTGTLWRPDVAVASEQVFPRIADAEIVRPDGTHVAVRVAGRDQGTNIVALRLASPVEYVRPPAAEPQFGALALALSADAGGDAEAHLAIVRALGPAWYSRSSGRIDRRIVLDRHLSAREEGGPVVDAAGCLIGMSTAGPRGRALVIPAATIERILEPLLTTGRVERGWLGAALHPVALPEAVSHQNGQQRGLMVLRVAAGGPAATAGVRPGDILLAVGGIAAAELGYIVRWIGAEGIGQPVELSISRAGAPITLSAVITARPASA